MLKKIAALFCALTVAFAFTSCEENNQGTGEELRKPAPEVTEQTETSVTIAWKAIENADSYIYVFNNGEEKTIKDVTVTISEGLTAGQKYSFKVKAHNEAGKYEDSQFANFEFTFSGKSATDNPWIGEWTVTSEAYFTWKQNAQGQLEPHVVQEEVTRAVVIMDAADYFEEGVEPNTGNYVIMGMSQFGQSQVPILAFDYESAEQGISGALVMVANQLTAEYEPEQDQLKDYGMMFDTFLPLGMIDDGEGGSFVYPIISGVNEPTFLITFDEGSDVKATSYGSESEFKGADGNTYKYTTVGQEYFGYFVELDDFLIWTLQEGPAKSMLGLTMTWEKKATKTSFTYAPNWNEKVSRSYKFPAAR